MGKKGKPLVDAWHILMALATVAEYRCLRGIGHFDLTTHNPHMAPCGPITTYLYPTPNFKIRPPSNINDPYSQISTYLQIPSCLLVILVTTTIHCGEYSHLLVTVMDM